MLSDIITENGLDLGIATPGNDFIIVSQLAAEQLAHFSASPFQNAIALLEGDDYLVNDNDAKIIYGNQGNDTIIGGNGNDTIFGGQDNDLLEAGNGNNILFGNFGNDTLIGGPGNDSLYGGAGNDVIIGGPGNSIISGDKGLDTLTGGGGANQFILQSSGADRDIITDFQPGIDKLRLPTGLTFNDLEVRGAGANTEIVRSGEVVAVLNGVMSSSINSNDFITAGQETPPLPPIPMPPVPTPVGDPPPPPGTTLAQARELGILTEDGLSLQDFVGDRQPNDYYRFTLPSNGRFSTTLGAVTQSANIDLIKDFNNNGMIDRGDGDVLTSTWASSTGNGTISRDIEAGTYYVRVSPRSSGNNTNYDLRFTFTPQPSTAPANPGNNMRNALDLGVISPQETRSFTEFVGDTDENDFYRFTLDSNRDVEFTLGSVRQSADIQLIEDFNENFLIDRGDGEILTSTWASSTGNGTISRALPAGTYYVRVSPRLSGNNTNYRLEISVT
ncbi:calcium-binding protein [Limnospira fusiformis]|uniref:calcium-binding protein n=1 Tax=Limnospira fusiformis TaxID=54297 RepID=UPI002AA1C171|nr:calcium-binding protein [Limnospira fusiformis LS22]